MLLSTKVLQTSKNSKILLSQFKLLSSQAHDNWDDANPYEDIPGPKTTFELIRLVGPGGRYKHLPLDKLLARKVHQLEGNFRV